MGGLAGMWLGCAVENGFRWPVGMGEGFLQLDDDVKSGGNG